LTYQHRSRFVGGGTVSQTAAKQQQQNTQGDNTMKQTLTTSQVADMLMQDDNAAWSYAGARALAEHLEEIDRESEQEMDFDRVAIRCEFSEYTSATEAAGNYDWEPGEDADEDEAEKSALQYLQDRTTVIKFTGGVIIQDY